MRSVPGDRPMAVKPSTTVSMWPTAQSDASSERRHLTVMFCDLVGSTALSARLDPEDLSKIMAKYHGCVSDVIVEGFGGYVARVMGDGALILFGFPQAHEDNAERAIRAALQVIETVSGLRLLGGYHPQVRIGIATGLVVVSVIGGTASAPVYDVAGETPNLAQRLQTLAEPNTVVIEACTWRLTVGIFEHCDLGLLEFKGFSGPVQAWRVLGTSATESRFEAQHQTRLTPLVGRDEEVELLLRCWREAGEGAGRVVILSGEPGIGKSRLTAMLLERVPPQMRLRYFCSQHLQGSPLHPFIQQMERAAGFVRGDSPAHKLAKLETALLPGSEHAQDFVLIADLLSLPADERYPKLHLAPRKRREQTMRALLRQLELLSQRHPVLMVLEDVQWIDPTSRDLLDLAIERMASLPVLGIITCRPEFQGEWAGKQHVSALTLRPLARQESLALIENIAGKGALLEEILTDIVARTDGVPLFLEELTSAILEASGHDDTATGATDQASPGLPARLRALLLARIDRLGSAKEIVQIGSALGREFSHELLAAVSGKSEEQLRMALERITSSGLAFRSGTPAHAAYLFKHALIQDAAYDTMLRATRQKLHQRIVEVLEGAFLEIVEAQPELVAHHCTEAGTARKAIGYWLKAGQRALARSTMQEAIARLRKGLDLAAQLPRNTWRHQQELDLQIALGKALIATKGYAEKETGETFARARQLCERLQQPPQLLTVLHGQWSHALLRADLASARRRAGELLEQGRSRNDVVWTLTGCRFSGITCFPLGEFAAGRDHLQRGLELFDPAQRAVYAAVTVDDAQVVMLTYLAYVLLYLGHPDQARERYRLAIAEARRLAQPYSLTHALFAGALIERTLRSPHASLEHLAELLPLSAEHGIAYFSAVGTIFRGSCLAAIGQHQEGKQALAQGLAAYRATGSILYLPTFIMLLADACGLARQPQEGLHQLTEAAQIVEATQTRVDEAEMHRVRGELLLAVQDSAAAAASFQQARAVARRQGARLWELRAAMSLAELWRDQGERSRARDLLAPVYGRIGEGFDTPVIKQAQALVDALG